MSMNYHVYKSIVLQTRRYDLATAYEMAEVFVAQKYLWYNEEDINDNPLMHLCELVQLLSNEGIQIVGDTSDYHNLATLYAQNRFHDYACVILEFGLKEYRDSTDLLADYIQYGMACGRIAQCKKYYAQLKTITKDLWSWRAYMFSVDYMLESLNDSYNNYSFLEIKNIADTFVDRYHIDEQALFTLSKVFHEFNRFDDEEKILVDAITQYSVAPKCSLRLADIYFERGEYDKAIPLLSRAIANATKTQAPINISYCHLLLVLCKIAPLLGALESNEISTDEMDIETKATDIFEHAHTAFQLNGLNDTLSINLQQILKLFELRFGVSNPYMEE